MSALPLPTDEQAHAFAVMLRAGLPPNEALLYFFDFENPGDASETLRKWQRCRAVQRAIAKLQSKPWTDMSLEEQMKGALDMHYAQLAYMLYSKHYDDATTVEKGKMDTARTSLEAKLAGTAGKGTELEQFFADLRSGRTSLPKPASMISFPVDS